MAKAYGRLCQKIGIIISVILSVLFLTLGRWFYGLYFVEPEIIQFGVQIMRFATVITLFQISAVIYMAASGPPGT